MAMVLVLHRVKDYGHWRQVYDSAAEMQKTGGVTEEAVFQAEDDPNNVLVLHRFNSITQAHSYFEDPALLEAVREAGVDENTVRLEFYEEA